MYSYPRNPGVEAAITAAYGPEVMSSNPALDAQPFYSVPVTSFSDILPWFEYADDGSAQRLHLIHYNKWTGDYFSRTITRDDLMVPNLVDTTTIVPPGSPITYTEYVTMFRQAEAYRSQLPGNLAPRGCSDFFARLHLCDPCPSAAGGVTKKPNGGFFDKICSGGGAGSPTNPPLPTGPNFHGASAEPLYGVIFGAGGAGSGNLPPGGNTGGSNPGGKPADRITASMEFRCRAQRCGWRGKVGEVSCPANTGSGTWRDESDGDQDCGWINVIYSYSNEGDLRADVNLHIVEAIIDYGMGEIVGKALMKDYNANYGNPGHYGYELIQYYKAVGRSGFNEYGLADWISAPARISKLYAAGEPQLEPDDYDWLRQNARVLKYAEENRGKFGNYQLKFIVDYIRYGRHSGSISKALTGLDDLAVAWAEMTVGKVADFQPDPVVSGAPVIHSVEPSVEFPTKPVFARNSRDREGVPEDIRVDAPVNRVSFIARLKSASDNLYSFHLLLDLFTYNPYGSRDYRAVADRYYDIFAKPQTTVIDVSDNTLESLISGHPRMLNYINNSVAEFQNIINEGGVLEGQSIRLNGVVARPAFNRTSTMGSDRWAGPTILINDTESAEWRVESYTQSATEWAAILHLTITDHFGLDEIDMLEFRLFHNGFESWYWLQHGLNYHPLKTRLQYRIKVTGSR